MILRAAVLMAILLAAGARAQNASEQTLAIGRQVYEASGAGANADAAGAFLRDAINGSGGRCDGGVTQFQRFRDTPGGRTLKVRCGDRPLFLLTVSSNGQMLLGGGNGSVGQFNRADGNVIDVTPAFTAQEQPSEVSEAADLRDEAPPVPAATSITGDSGVPDSSAVGRLGWVILIAVGLGISVAVAVQVAGRAEKKLLSGDVHKWRGLKSADKDRLIEEAREVYPDIWSHPDGIFIAKGKRRKRRLFRTLAFAYLYRNYGWKIREVF